MDAAALRELLSKSGRVRPKREGVAHLQAVMGLSERRGLLDLGADRKMIRTAQACRRTPSFGRSCAISPTSGNVSAIGGCSSCCGRSGDLGHQPHLRLYCEEGLTVRKRRARRRAVGTRAPILAESNPNGRWSVDFVHDQFACSDDNRRSRRPERQLILCRRPSSTSTPSSVGIAQMMSAVACRRRPS